MAAEIEVLIFSCQAAPPLQWDIRANSPGYPATVISFSDEADGDFRTKSFGIAAERLQRR